MQKDQFQFEPSKKAFINKWPGGYRENFAVFQQQCGASEEEVVQTCLTPHLNPNHVAVEIGCGGMFWVEKYLIPGFFHVYGIDLQPKDSECVRRNVGNQFTYIEAGNRDYSCQPIPDNSVDFVWSFGVFCHLPIFASKAYVESAFRILKPGGTASLFFSNTDRWPGHGTVVDRSADPDGDIFWCENNWETTRDIVTGAGFVDVKDLMPKHCNTIVGCRKP